MLFIRFNYPNFHFYNEVKYGASKLSIRMFNFKNVAGVKPAVIYLASETAVKVNRGQTYKHFTAPSLVLSGWHLIYTICQLLLDQPSKTRTFLVNFETSKNNLNITVNIWYYVCTTDRRVFHLVFGQNSGYKTAICLTRVQSVTFESRRWQWHFASLLHTIVFLRLLCRTF